MNPVTARPRSFLRSGTFLLSLGLGAAALLLGGCVSGPSYSEVSSSLPPIASGMGRVYFYRTYNYVGSATAAVIALNGEVVGQCGAGGFFYVDRPPGPCHVADFVEFFGTVTPGAQQTFLLSAGQSVYVRVRLSMGAELDLVPAAQATGEIAGVGYAGPYSESDLARRPRTVRVARTEFESYRQMSGMEFPAAAGVAAEAPAPAAAEMPRLWTSGGGTSPGSLFSSSGSGAQTPVFSPEASTAAGPAVPTPAETEALLDRNLLPAPQGIYAADSEYNFNVLDFVTFDPATHALSLVGHEDANYRGPRIPYLQYLSALLESPKPEFSLELTRDSSARVDAFFNETMSPEEGGRISEELGQVADADGEVSEVGRSMLPAMGIYPIPDNRAPGYLGIETSYLRMGQVQVVSVVPGSPAALAGIQPGFVLIEMDHSPALYPSEIVHRVRLAGAGSPLELAYIGNGRYVNTQVTLGASPDPDPWKDVTRYDVIAAVYRADGKPDAAKVMYTLGVDNDIAVNHASDTALVQASLTGFFAAAGISDQMNTLRQEVQARSLSMADVMGQSGRLIADRLEQLYDFPPGSLYAAFQSNLQSTGNFSTAIAAIFNEFDVQIKPRFGQLLDRFIFRPEGLQIPAELVEREFHVHPEMYPEYLGVPADSQLARLMFRSDYLAKRLIGNPDISRFLPAYQTSFGFERSHPEFARNEASYRLWISVARMDTPQSPSGRTLEFRNVRMRFNVRELGADGRDLPNQPGSYEELLTSLYEPLSRHYLALHELEEAAKLAAAARWIQAHDPGFHLPAAGRLTWQGPSRVPGLVYIYLYPDEAQHTHVHFVAAGGVSLVPFPPGNGANPFADDSSVVDLTQSSGVAPLLRSPSDPEGSPPGYEAIKLYPGELAAGAGALRQDQARRFKLSELRVLLQQLADVEQAITVLGTGDVAGLKALQERRRELRAEFDRSVAATLVQVGNDLIHQLEVDTTLGEAERSTLANFAAGNPMNVIAVYLARFGQSRPDLGAPGVSPSDLLDPTVIQQALAGANDPVVAGYLAQLNDLGPIQFLSRSEAGYAALDPVVDFRASGPDAPAQAAALGGHLTAFEGQLSAETVAALNDPDVRPYIAAPGTDTRASDQLASAAQTAQMGGNKADLTPNFDSGTAVYAGSLPVPADVGRYGAAMAEEVAGFSDRVRNDPEMKSELAHLAELRSAREKLGGELDELVSKRNAPGGTTPAMNEAVDQKQAEYQKSLLDIVQADTKIEKLHRTIDATVEAPPALP